MCLHNIYHRALLTMNVTLDIYMVFHIIIIVLIIYHLYRKGFFKVCHSKENCIMDDMHF